MSTSAGGPRAAIRAVRWSAPSLAGALGATLASGVVDAARFVDRTGGSAGDSALRIAVVAAYSAVVAAPFALALALVARAIVAAWQPRALVARLTDDSGAAPRLAGWLGGALVGLALLALATNQGVWFLARATAFRVRTVSIILPVILLVATAAIVLVAGTIAVGLGRALAALERRRARPLLTPRRVLGAMALLAIAAAGVAWWLVVRPLVRALAVDGLGFVGLGLVLLVAIHAGWPRLGRRAQRRALVAVTAAAALLGAAALWARQARPTTLLSLWGGDGFGAFAIDVAIDVDATRADVPRAELAPAPRPGAPRRDVVLLTIDTFRPDRLAAYGGPVPTPALAGLAGRGALFEIAYAPSNVTRRSIPAIITGLAPTRVRGRVRGWALRMDPRHVTVAERLRAAGYDTIGLFCCEGFWSRRRPTGLERGFTDLVIQHDADALIAAAAARLEVRKPDSPPLYMWLHFIELHEWAGGDPDMRPERRRLYDDALTRMDASVGRLLEVLGRLPPERQPIVIITGDHSEALGDHGAPFHATDLYGSQLQVPLFIAGPGIVAQRIPEVVSLLDLVPTILDLAGFTPPGHPILDGRSLADLLTGARPSDVTRGRAYAAMIADRFIRASQRALVVGRWKLIHHGDTGREELYELGSDPREMNDRAARDPVKRLELRRALLEQRARDLASPFPR